MKFRKFDISQKKQRKALIEIFINAIFLYDDRMLITFNYKDGTQTVRFEDTLTADSAEGKSSDLSSLAGPFASQSNNLRVGSIEELFCFIRSFFKQQSRSPFEGCGSVCFCILIFPLRGGGRPCPAAA